MFAGLFPCARAWANVSIAPVPSELASGQFTVTIDGHPATVAHAAANYYFLNFDLKGKARISITAPTNDYWAKGVEVQPWRLGIRPKLAGRTISFTLDSPAKLSITRPGDHLADAEMLFLFANAPETDAPSKASPGIRFYGPGVYHENIDAKSGDSIYLAPGAVVFGGLNIWGVENVKVFGRGVLVYDGPQDPDHDTGWMHKKNWHVIVMDNAHHIQISGITCVVRSRTWMIQMRDSRDVRFDNVKVIGGSKGNANQDGMDWLGGGDTVVKDSFIRAADDIFAMYGNWDGYTDEALTTPGHEVSNITVEDSVLSTSISNVVRVGWPRKIFDSHQFTMRNSDVIHMGMGSCGVPFALFEIWADPAGKGEHSDFLFDDVRLENWYALTQLRQPNPGIHNVRFKNIWAIEQPSMAPSALAGEVDGVAFQNVNLAGTVAKSDADVPLEVKDGAREPEYGGGGPVAAFTYSAGALAPHRKVLFDASASHAGSGKIASYTWSFGDGTRATGRTAHHAFPDDEGTLWDHSGRFRVLLEVADEQGAKGRIYEPVVVADSSAPAAPDAGSAPGLSFRYFEADPIALASLAGMTPATEGTVDAFTSSIRKRAKNYGIVFDGLLDVPATGGYTFTLLSNDEGRLEIDSRMIAESPKPWPQVCGSAGNAVQPASGSMGLAAGKHRIRVAMTHTAGEDGFALKWQGPGIPLADVPKTALSH